MDGALRSAYGAGGFFDGMKTKIQNENRILKGRASRAFVLLEVLIGVSIFAIGIIALGQAMSNCMLAEGARMEDQRAHAALQSEMAQIEAGMVQLTTTRTVQLDGASTGITLVETRTPLALQNENNQQLTGLYSVTIEADWKQDSQPQSKTITFYVYRP
jgi:type II secretory pathway component PulJ